MQSHILSSGSTLPTEVIREIANSGVFDEIPNYPGSVRRYIFNSSMRDKTTNKTRKPILFAIYQTGRHGPQNGYRLCLVHSGFYIASSTKLDTDPEDDIDRLEKDLADEGHEEIIILGERHVISDK